MSGGSSDDKKSKAISTPLPRGRKALTPMPTNSTNYRHFSTNYFSGSDVRIYFGDIWIDEVSNLQFTLQEQVAPIFGYASYTWDRVARGTRFIEGSFSINFKETAYLQTVLNSLSLEIEEDPQTGYFNKGQFDKNMNIETLLAQKGENFYDIADELEKSFWGEGDQQAQVANKTLTSHFYPSMKGGTEIGGLNQHKLNETGFNIVITYGGPNMDGRPADSYETTQVLMGVQLTAVGQQIGPDGTPVQEFYQFIARDLQGDARTSGY